MKRLLILVLALSMAAMLVPEKAEANTPEVVLPQFRSSVLRRHVDLNKVSFLNTIGETARSNTFGYHRGFPWFSTFLDGPSRAGLYRNFLSSLRVNNGNHFIGSYYDPLRGHSSRRQRSRFVCEAGLPTC